MPALLPRARPTPSVTVPARLASSPSSTALWPMAAFTADACSRLVGGAGDAVGVLLGVGLRVLHDDAVAGEGVALEVTFEHDRRRVGLVPEQRRLVAVVEDRHLHALAGDGEGHRLRAGLVEAARHDGALDAEPVGAEGGLLLDRLVGGLEVHRGVAEALEDEE